MESDGRKPTAPIMDGRQTRAFLPTTPVATNQTNGRPQPRRCPSKGCCQSLAAIWSFTLVLMAALALLTAGFFKEQVNHEERARVQFKLYGLLNLIAVLMFCYAIAGLVLKCQNKIQGKVSSSEKRLPGKGTLVLGQSLRAAIRLTERPPKLAITLLHCNQLYTD